MNGERENACPGCGHRWGAHTGRNGDERCNYRPYAGYSCPCRLKNPDIAADDRLAGALWRMLMYPDQTRKEPT